MFFFRPSLKGVFRSGVSSAGGPTSGSADEPKSTTEAPDLNSRAGSRKPAAFSSAKLGITSSPRSSEAALTTSTSSLPGHVS